MRRIWRRREDGTFYEVGDPADAAFTQLMPDIKPYHNVIDGTVIGSRSEHRNFLKRHNVEEVGDTMPAPEAPVTDREQLKNDIREARRQLEWNEAPTLEQLGHMAPEAMKEMGPDE